MLPDPNSSASSGESSFQPPLVVLLCADLMLTSSVSGAAMSAGVRFVSSSDVATAVTVLTSATSRRLFVDLATPGLTLPRLAESICADDLRNAVAYGPHVHESLLATAREAGIGTVLSRGQFSSRYPMLIQELLQSSGPLSSGGGPS